MTLEPTLLEILRQAPLPLKAVDIAKQAKLLLGKQATPAALKTALQSLVTSGALTVISGGTQAKPQPLYTTQSPARSAAVLLKEHLHTAGKPQEAARLKAKLPLGLRDLFEDALADLVAHGAAFAPPSGKRLVYAQRPKPSSVLSSAQRRTLQSLFEKVNGLRLSPATLASFIAWLDEQDATPAPEPTPEIPVLPPNEALLREWYEQDRLRSSTAMIPIPLTFARYDAWAHQHGGRADSQVLRNFMEGLYNNGYLLLEPCERPQDLPDHERAMLVPMSLGPPGWSWCWMV